MSKMSSAKIVTSLLGLLSVVSAHSWIERLNVIAPNGTMIGAGGFPRGNVLRTASDFSDTLMVNLIPPNGGVINVIDPTTLMCRQSQTTQTQTTGSPRLKAAAGSSVALRYQENGHVTLPQNQPGKPPNRGTIYVYYTTQSKATDEFLQIHRQWTPDGKGGDGRGKLISTSNFDDHQCYQVNSGAISTQRQQQFKHTADNLQGADLWCQQDIQIPTDAPAGSPITLYWVWDWPTMPGTAGFPQGKQEIYTTCMDIDVEAPSPANKIEVARYQQQDFVSAAASSQFMNIANPTAVSNAETIAFSDVSSASSVSTSASSASQSSTVSVSSSPVPGTTVASVAPEKTITQFVTVTATAFAGTPSQPSSSSTVPIVTVIETDYVTSTMYNTLTSLSSQASPESSQSGTTTTTTSSSISAAMSSSAFSSSTTVGSSESTSTATPESSVSPVTKRSSSGTCSVTESAYRLRARKPFYIPPSSDFPDSTGC